MDVGMYTSKIVSSTNEINKDDWNALVVNNVFITYEWLHILEQTFLPRITPLYIHLYESTILVAASACYIFNELSHVYSLDNWLFGRLKKYVHKVGVSFLPALICCPVKCYGSHFLIKKTGPDEVKYITRKLLTSIEAEALSRKLSIGFPNVMNGEDELEELLNIKGYNKTSGPPLNYLDIEWPNFEGYKKHIRHLSKNAYKIIKREINKNKKEGVIIKQLNDIGSYGPRLLELVNDNYNKHNKALSPYKLNFFQCIRDNFRDDAVIYIAVKKDKIIGMSMLLKRNEFAYALLTGVDHDMAGNDFTYFNLCYYRPISDACTEQLKRLYYGNALYEMKKRRGCKTSQAFIYYKSQNSLKNKITRVWFSIHSLWMRYKISES